MLGQDDLVAVPGFANIGYAVNGLPPVEQVGLWTEVCKQETTWTDIPEPSSTIKYCED